MKRLALFAAAIVALLIVTVPSAGSAFAQTCARSSSIAPAGASIKVESSLPACDSRGNPMPERILPTYVSPLDPDYGARIAHGGSAPQSQTIAPTTTGSTVTTGQHGASTAANGS